MRVLVIGSGAREHAIVHALRRSPEVRDVFCAPGNPGIAMAADCLPLVVDDLPGIAEAASDLQIDLTVVGPELPLSLGIVDEFNASGLRVFGPSRAAAQLETSKVFSKEFCLRHQIPTARAEVVCTKEEVGRVVGSFGFPVVLKANGLAAGKGVLILREPEDLDRAIDLFFVQRSFGDAGDQILVEEFLEGAEISFMAVCDGKRAYPLASARDYKRLQDGNEGPNTGGMGSHSPVFGLPRGLGREIMERVIQPTVDGMAAEGREYRGVLYAGLMLTEGGFKVLEFNCRFGDPETQSVLLRLEGSLFGLLKSAADGQLDPAGISWRREIVACVVAASEGYPRTPRKGLEILGTDEALDLPGVTIYHAGTKMVDGILRSSGGRVLSVCGRGPNLKVALERAYSGIGKINFEGMHYRRDIGADSLAILQAEAVNEV